MRGKRKKRTKTLLHLSALVLCLALMTAGCSKAGPTEDAGSVSAAQTETAGQSKKQASGRNRPERIVRQRLSATGNLTFFAPYEEESYATGKPILIGGFGSLSGNSAVGGTYAYRGAELAIKWINHHGGVNGRPLELIMYDDGTTTIGAIKAVTRLVEQDKVSVILGGHVSPDVAAAMTYTEEKKIPMVGIGTGLSWTKCGASYTWRGTISGHVVYPALLKEIEEVGDTSLAFFYSENDYGRGAWQYFIEDKALENHKIEVTEVCSFPTGETDFTEPIQKALRTNPSSVMVVCASEQEFALFIKQLRELGFRGIVYGPENVAATIVMETAGALANGTAFGCATVGRSKPEEESNLQAQYVIDNYIKDYGEDFPTELPYRGWDAVMIIAQALSRVEDTEDPEAINEAIRSLSRFEGVQGVYDFTAGDGDGLQKVKPYMILNGGWVRFNAKALNKWRKAQNE